LVGSTSGPTEGTAWAPAEDVDASYVCFPKDRTVVVDDGTPIAYTIVGDGPRLPLLFANGWSCSDAYWVDIVPRLAEAGHPCIVPDNRGHGRSGLPRRPGRGARNLHPDDFTVERMGRDLLAVLDDAGIAQAGIVGHSMGVQTALEAYRFGPDRVAALVLVAGSFENPLRTFYGTSLAHAMFPVVKAVMAWAPEVARPLWSTIGNPKVGLFGARLVGAAGPKTTAEGLHPYLLHLRSVDLPVMVKAIASMREHTAADLLPDIHVPTLILAAGRDTFTPPGCQARMHAAIPGSEIVWFETAGHTLPIEEPEAIAADIEAFLDRRTGTKDAATKVSTKMAPVKRAAAKKARAKEAGAKRKATAKAASARCRSQER
jgi:pimeloyl-ACP methyl ester carboxylesterase